MQSNIESKSKADELLGKLTAEFQERLAKGENPSVEAYVNQYPEVAQLIRDIFPLLGFIGASPEDSDPVSQLDSLAATPTASIQQLGDFRLLSELGRGGMGVVYEAEQISMRRRVALKLLPFATLLDTGRLKRFKNEVLAAASLNHPNIVSVYSVGEERGIHYYAMQLIQGPTLAEIVLQLQSTALPKTEINTTVVADQAKENTKSEAATSSVGKYPTRDYFQSVARIGIQISQGLAEAHRQGVLHRDIKPANIILDADCKPYIADFGMAQIETDTQLTMTGDLLGTLRYMSPEQASGQRVLDPRTDIYSLGTTLYELLTLQPAFPADDRNALLNQVIKSTPPPPRKLARSVPPELESIVLKAMAERPVDRYASAQLMQADLQRFLDGKPTLAKPPSLFSKVTKWSARNPAIVAATLASMLILASAATVSNIFLRKAWFQADEAQQQAMLEASNATKSANATEAINQFLTDYVLARAAPGTNSDVRSDGTQAINPFREALDNAAEYADRKFPDDPILKASLYRTIAQLYLRLGEYDKSETHLRRTLELLDEIDSPHAERLSVMNELGSVFTHGSRDDEAEEILRESVSNAESILDEGDPIAMQGRLRLAKVLIRKGKLDEAEVLARQCVRAAQALYGQESREAAFAEIVQAEILIERDERTEAEPLLRNAVDQLLAKLGIEDLDVQDSMLLLGDVYRQDANFEAAEALYRDILQARMRIQGSTHPLTSAIMIELADLLYSQERFPEAQALLTDVLRTQLSTSKTAYEASPATKARLTDLLWKQGRLNEAAEILRTSNQITMLQDASNDMDAIFRYGDTLLSVGDYALAEEYLRSSLLTIEKEFGSEHPAAGACACRLGFALYAQRKSGAANTEAMKYLLAIDRLGGDPSSWMVEMIGLKSIVDHLYDAPIEDLLARSLAYRRAKLPESHLAIATTLSIYGQNLIGMGRHREAEPLLKECLDIRQRGLPPKHWLIAETKNIYGACCVRLGRFAEAEELLLKSCEEIEQHALLPKEQKSEWIDRVCTLYEALEVPEKTLVWHRRSAAVLGELVADWSTSVAPNESFYVAVQLRYGRRLLDLRKYAEAERVLLQLCASLAINARQPADLSRPYVTHEVRNELANLYSLWGKNQDKQRWNALIELLPSEGEYSSIATHRQIISLWNSICRQFEDPLFRIRLARAYLDAANNYRRIGRPDQAVLGAQKAVGILAPLSTEDPSNVAAAGVLVLTRLSLGDGLTQLGRHAEARDCFKLALAESQSLPREAETTSSVFRRSYGLAQRGYARFLVECPDSNIGSPKRVLDLANSWSNDDLMMPTITALAHLKLGDSQSAIELLRSVSTRPDRNYVLAMAYQRQGDRNAALNHYNQAISSIERGMVRRGAPPWEWQTFQERYLDLATQELQISATERKAITAYWRGIALSDSGQYELASESLQQSVELRPEHADGYLQLSRAFLETGPDKLHRAAEAVEKYFDLRSEGFTADAYEILGRIRDMTRQPDQAVAALETALRLREQHGESNAATHYYLAEAYGHRGDGPEAIQQYEQAISLQPDNLFLKGTLAWMLVNYPDEPVRDPLRAIELAKAAIEASPYEPEFWKTLGVAHYRCGEYAAAQSAMETFVEKSEEPSTIAWLFLAMSHWQQSNHDEARMWLNKVSTLIANEPIDAGDPSFEFLVEAKELIAAE